MPRALVWFTTLALGAAACGGDTAATTTSTAAPVTTATTTDPVTTTTARPPSGVGADPVRIALINAAIVTMDPAVPLAEALLIEDGRIAAVGANDSVISGAGPGGTVVDLAGAVVYPGFIDAHTHRISQRFKWGLDSIEDAANLALAQGWTTVTELAMTETEFAEFRLAAQENRLPVRVDAYLAVNGFAGEELEHSSWFQEFQPGQVFGDTLRVAGLKIFIDFDSGRTLLWSPAPLGAFIAARRAEGWQIAMKAIGVASHELALTALEGSGSGPDDRPRIEHSLATTDDQVTRMAALGAIASIQPSFPAVIWHEEDIRDLSDEHGADLMFRWPDYLAAGLHLAGSPYNPDGVNESLTGPSHVAPMGLLYRSLTQIGMTGDPPESWMLTRTLPVATLLEMITTGAAYSLYAEGERGVIAPEALADLVVLSADPQTSEPANLLGVTVNMTLVAGDVRWCSVALAAVCHAIEAANGDRVRVSASATLADSDPGAVFDGDNETAWISGGAPHQWIQVEFPEPRTVSMVRLVVAQDPAGLTTHTVLLGTGTGELEAIHEFSATTSDGDVLQFELATPREGVTVVRILTTASPSWVAWREVEIG